MAAISSTDKGDDFALFDSSRAQHTKHTDDAVRG